MELKNKSMNDLEIIYYKRKIRILTKAIFNLMKGENYV